MGRTRPEPDTCMRDNKSLSIYLSIYRLMSRPDHTFGTLNGHCATTIKTSCTVGRRLFSKASTIWLKSSLFPIAEAEPRHVGHYSFVSIY